MKRNQLMDDNDPVHAELRINGDENGLKQTDVSEGKINITEPQELKVEAYYQDSPQKEKEIIKQVATTNRFGVTKLELIISSPIAIILLVYHLTIVAHRTLIIHEQTPMKDVVISWFGFFRDDSDFQWREFRENLFLFLIGMSLFVLISYAIKTYFKNSPQDRFKYQIYFYLLTGITYLIFLFRGGFVMWLFFTLSNYFIQRVLYKYRFYSYVLWTYSIWILYYIFYYQYQPFEILSFIFPKLGASIYDSHKNALIPWNWVLNMTLLRVMSFCFDKNWHYLNSYKFDAKKHQERCQPCQLGKACYKSRSEQYLEPEYYNSIIYYYAYLTYLPVFITGPQITFNAFISQVLQNQNTITKSKVKIYFVRALNNILVLELYTHLSFASALSKVRENESYWINFSFCECLFMGFLNLIFIWLKFLTIWRLARAFSLLDGIDCPENMNRCIFNNYCFEGFWRSWHRGFNQWLIRYLFIPLGGSRTKYWNIWIIFTFVAIWHDFQLNLVLWAWFICLALVPEMIVKNWVTKKTSLWQIWWFKYLCALTATLYIWLMVLANLIGFGNGWYNIEVILGKLSEPGAFKQVLLVVSSMYFLPIIQFYIRDQEQDKGF